MKTRAMYGLLCLAALLGLAVWIGPAESQDREQAQPSDEIQRLLVERRDTLRELANFQQQAYEQGIMGIGLEDLILSREVLLDAELDLATTKEDRVKVQEARLENMRTLETHAQQRQAAGVAGGETTAVLAAKAARLKAEADLLKAQNSDDGVVR